MVHQSPIHVLCPLQLVQLLHKAVVAQDGSEVQNRKDAFKCRLCFFVVFALYLERSRVKAIYRGAFGDRVAKMLSSVVFP